MGWNILVLMADNDCLLAIHILTLPKTN
jgi:hypothetical protein